jgi:hypothetical protein
MKIATLDAPDFTRLSRNELLALFATLDAPAIDEMNGEYASTLLASYPLLDPISRVVLRNPITGTWLGKAFRPLNGSEGRGYNLFRSWGRTVQRYPMRTRLAPSRYDGRPAYQLVYRAFHSFCGAIHMVDELRRVEPGVYLGVGTCGFSDAQRRIPLPFLLRGPTQSCRGDIGLEREGFDWSN